MIDNILDRLYKKLNDEEYDFEFTAEELNYIIELKQADEKILDLNRAYTNLIHYNFDLFRKVFNNKKQKYNFTVIEAYARVNRQYSNKKESNIDSIAQIEECKDLEDKVASIKSLYDNINNID